MTRTTRKRKEMKRMDERKKKAVEKVRKGAPFLTDYEKGWFAGICEAWAMMAEANGTGNQSAGKEMAQK